MSPDLCPHGVRHWDMCVECNLRDGRPTPPISGTANKDKFGGSCYRAECEMLRAMFYNQSTRKYYCVRCAALLNHANRADAERLFGSPLCINVSHPNHPYHEADRLKPHRDH